MCGLLGWFTPRPAPDDAARFDTALDRLAHRGPDDRGVFAHQTAKGHLRLGHRRLSIIDLSAAGHQPFQSTDGRYILVFNGEIYNYRELRDALAAEGVVCRTRTDTEVLLEAWRHWGRDVLPRLIGMFAFAVLDRHNDRLALVRDGFGIKPLYYGWHDGAFLFGSDIRALRTLMPDPALNMRAVFRYLHDLDYDQDGETFLDGLRQLPPGHVMDLPLTQDASISQHTAPPQQRWWHPGIGARPDLSFTDTVAALRETFLHSVRLHMRSDVPLGVALSGGIDSAAIAGAVRHLEPDADLATYSFIADHPRLSEERWVDLSNAATGATPNKTTITRDVLIRDLDRFITAQGEPCSGLTVFAQFRVNAAAHEDGIKVLLEGQGADELLGGYDGYAPQRLASLIETGQWGKARHFFRGWCRWPGRKTSAALRRAVLQELFARRRPAPVNPATTPWLDLTPFQAAGIPFTAPFHRARNPARGRRVANQMRARALEFGLPRLLRHGDRNAMHFSIENRVPFATPALAELGFSLPESHLVSPTGRTKHAFREAMRGIVPDAILDRRDKIGFTATERDLLWSMADDVRDWLDLADAVPFLDSTRLRETFDGFLTSSGSLEQGSIVWRWINFLKWYHLVFLDRAT
ncbi:asparagine synthase (glutamine-hydrolyzing) [Yunchengibacter salinarum]|uniref:asparagine synthase (glutamine-hydrolyzing) n=1 Tax=Yunchengibacter salinarum TaxID=3133399 RepID=UPI0035B5CE4D